MPSQRTVDRVIAVLAALCCMVLALGLVDTPRTPISSAVDPRLPEGIERDAELVVTVMDARGQRLVGARISVFWKQADIYYWVGRRRSTAAGVARFTELPRGVVWVLAEKEGYARTSTQLALGAEPREARVKLGKGHQLQVRVMAESGEALDAATVLVADTDPLPHGELSDARGFAAFSRLGAPPWQVRVSARGFETKRLTARGEVLVTLRRLGALAVHVVDATGRPQPGATVVMSSAKLWPARKTTTNSEGVASITGLLAGSYDLRAFRDGLVSQTLFGFALGEGQHDEVTLTLGSGRMIRVLVTDGEGEMAPPVARADVVLVEDGIGSFPLEGRTADDGTLQLGPIAAGPAVLAARADGFVARSGVRVPDDTSGAVRIGLQRGATLAGEVVDAEGYPIGGASIEVIGSDLFGLPVSESPLSMNFTRAHFEWALAGPVPLVPAGELGVMPGPVPAIPGLGAWEASAPQFADAPAEVAPWVTRESGEFSAFPVTPGRVRALVRHPDFVETLSEAVTLTPGGQARVRVELFRGGVLEGRVLDHAGFPVAGANIELAALQGTYERFTVSAHDGGFAFAAVPKQVVISVARPDEPGQPVLREHLEVGEGRRTEIELSLPERRSEVSVIVVGEQDFPVELAQVTIASLDANVPRRETFFSDASGRVTAPDLEGLPLEIAVEASGSAPARVQVVRATSEMSVQLRRGVVVTGSVTAVRGRALVAGARITLLAAGERRMALSDEFGHYRFENVPRGAATLAVEHPDYARATRPVRVVDTGRLDRPLELEPVDLSEPGSVAGVVLDASGTPVPGARIAIGFVPAYLPAGALPPGVATSDTEGRFLLEGVSPGTVSVGAYATDVGRGSTPGVAVESGRTVDDLVVRLDQAVEPEVGSLRGNVAVTLGERGGGANLEVVVVSVAEASEAERAGLRAGDRLVSVEGQHPANMLEARLLLSGAVGSHVPLEISRRGQREALSVIREQVRR